MIVVHLAEYASGGIATYLRTLIKCQCQNKEITRIYLFVSDKKSEKFIFQSPKVKIIRYKYTRSIMGIKQIVDLYSSIRVTHPDVLHLHSSFAGILRIKFIFLRPKNLKIVYCAHGWAFTRDISVLKKKVYGFLEKILAHGCNSIINISKSEQKAAINFGINAKKMNMIYNSTDIQLTSKKKMEQHAKKAVLFVGRFDRQKGLDILLNANKKLLGEIDLRIIGAAVLDDGNQFVGKSSGNIQYLGWLPPKKVHREMREADVVVIPSRWEGFGLTAIEAMSEQTAVIASNVGGLAEIVQNEETGILIPPNDPSILSATIKRVDRQELYEMGNQGSKRARKLFDSVIMEHQIFDLYQQG